MGELAPQGNDHYQTTHFRIDQIVCLEHGPSRLYAEVVQFIETRQRYWVRLIALAVTADPDSRPAYNTGLPLADPFILYDLRQSSDLLWPACLFRPAIDTEVVALLPTLYGGENCKDTNTNQAARQQLNQFIQQVWQAHSGVFETNARHC